LAHIEIAQRSARGTLLLFLGNAISAAIAAAAAIVIARLLGPTGYGAYSLALVIPTIFVSFTGFGVNLAITRYSAYHISGGELDKAKRITKNAILFLTLNGAILTIVVFLVGGWLTSTVLHRSDLGSYVQIASLVVLGQTIFSAVIAAFVGWNSAGLASITSTLQAVLKLVLATLLILGGFGIAGAMIGHVVGYLGAGAIGFIVLYAAKLRGPSSDVGGFPSDIREMIAYGVPPYIGTVIAGLAAQYVTIILALIAANAVVGYYQAALNVTAAITLVSSAIATALFAGFSSLDGVKGDSGIAFSYAVKYASFVSIPIVMFLVAGAGVLMKVLYGPFYSSGVQYLQLLALTNLPIAIGSSVTPNFFSGVGKTRLTMQFYIAGAIALVILAPLFATAGGLGVVGLIYAQIAANLAAAGIGLYLASKRVGARIDWKSGGAIVLASVIALAAIDALPAVVNPVATLIGYLVVYCGVYITAIPLVRGLGRDDFIRLSIVSEGFGALKLIVNPILRYERFLLRLTGGER
jgi:O-antigen/teichoic acid export membrane protein